MSDTRSGNAGRILIVEDEKDITTLFVDFMRDLGYEVLAVDDGATALEIIGSYSADVVVSDIRLPKIDGDELYRRAVNISHSYASKFIFITAAEINTTLQKFLAETKCPVFLKPFDILELVSVIESKIAEKGEH